MRTGGAEYGVGVVLRGPSEVTITSQAFTAPFSSWPPELGANNVNFPTAGRVAFTAFEPGELGFVATDIASGQLVLGGTVPGENGATFLDLPLPSSPLHFAARSGLGSYLIGTGFPTFVTAHLVDGFVAPASVMRLPDFGCADMLPAAAAVALTDADGFWLANAADLPFDNCIDPDIPGPALFVQLHRIQGGSAEPYAAVELDEPAVEIDVAASDGVVWLGVRTANSLTYDVYRDDLSTGPIASLSTEGVAGEHALATIGSSLAIARVVPTTSQPGGEFTLILVAPDGTTSELQGEFLPPFALGEPAIITSVDPPAVLTVYIEEGDVAVLSRADCIAPPDGRNR